MKEYSEKELLMLSNFVYVPASVSTAAISDILDMYRDAEGGFTAQSVAPAGYGGGMGSDDIAVLFGEMDRQVEEDPVFGQLSASRILEEEDVRAICYTDKKDQNPVVAFRGTGGTVDAWTDNFEGAYERETKIQQIAGDFVHYECSEYEEITVTGHSKGGNMAQFAAITCNDNVKRCVSYDGQGFGEEFIKSHRKEIKAASPNIKSISAYNDFVNILLTCVAGEVIYVNNKEGAVNAHSSISLLTENEYDESGNFTSIQSRGMIAGGLKNATDEIAFILRGVEKEDKKIMARVAGDAIVGAFETLSDADPGSIAALAIGAVSDYYYRKITDTTSVVLGEGSLCVSDTSIMWNELNYMVSGLNGVIIRARVLKNRLQEMKEDINYTIAAKIYAEKIVNRAISSIETSVMNCENYCNLLLEIASRYRERENTVSGLFRVQ